MNKLRQQILAGELPERRSLLGKKRTKGADAEAGLTSVDIPREEHRKSDSRNGDRHRLVEEQPVCVVHKRKRHDVQLINLSGGGAMIAGDLEPNLWDRVELHLGEDGKIECAVRWIKGGRIGLEFAHETRLDCSEEAQAKLLQAVIDLNFSDLEISSGTGSRVEEEAEEQRDTPQPGDHRDSRRHPLIWSGVLHYDFGTTPVRLRDISEKGALIECQTSVPVGAEPLLDLGEAGQIFGKVTWAIGDHLGLRFSEPFDMQKLAHSRPDVTPPQWEAPNYLKSSPAAHSPWDEKWDRLSVDELRDQLDGFMKR